MAYAADYTKDEGNYNVGYRKADDVITLNRMFDCSVRNLTNGEYTKLFAVPANFQVLEAYVTCLTSETSANTDTLDIVDDDSATTTFVDDARMLAGTITATNARKLYTSAGYICVLPNHALATAVFEVCIRGKILNKSA